MKIAFLDLCHTDPEVTARIANRLTKEPDFDIYIHVDAKADIKPFEERLSENPQVYFIQNRQKVYWGGYNAVKATYTLLDAALNSQRQYDYFVVMQNLDYPIKSNEYIKSFFTERQGTEFIRGCRIAETKDWIYAKKYRLYYKKDNPYGKTSIKDPHKFFITAESVLCSLTTIFCNGNIHEKDGSYAIYYGAAQWAVTRECAEYMISFMKTHPRFNAKMKIMQFPDEEYFHTVVHNSRFRTHCSAYDEPEKRWLVNWRNLTYFEFPKEVTVLTEKDFDKVMAQPDLFCRKVRTGESDRLMDLIDEATENDNQKIR